MRGMAAEGNESTPASCNAGLMISPSGEPRVIEHNCAVLATRRPSPSWCACNPDLVALCECALDGNRDTAGADWDPRSAIGVVLAAGGYPGDYGRGHLIRGWMRRNQTASRYFTRALCCATARWSPMAAGVVRDRAGRGYRSGATCLLPGGRKDQLGGHDRYTTLAGGPSRAIVRGNDPGHPTHQPRSTQHA